MATVKEILNSKGNGIISVRPETPISEVLKVLAEKKIGAVLVMKEGDLEGIFSERDFVRLTALQGCNVNAPVGDVMTKRVYYMEPRETVERCMVQMSDKHIRHLPVVEDGKVLGVISIGDVVKSLISDYKDQIEGLENFIVGAEVQL